MKSKGLLDRHDSFLKNYSDSAQDGPLLLLLLLEASLNSLAPNKKKRRKMIVASHHYLPLENIWKRNSTHFSRKSFQEISSHQNSPRSPISTNDVVTVMVLLTVLRSMDQDYIDVQELCVRDLIFDDDLVDRLEPAWKQLFSVSSLTLTSSMTGLAHTLMC